MPSKTSRILALCLALAAWLSPLAAAEGGISKDYTDARFQLYKDNVFFCELRAKKAHADHIGESGVQRFVMREGVVIDVYDTAAPQGEDDERPPLKLRITSETGTYSQVMEVKTRALQDVVVFDGSPDKPVVVERFRPGKPGGKPVLDAVIVCNRTAKWNNTASVLNGSGGVTMRKEDRTMVWTGDSMVYEMDEKNRGKVDLTESGNQDLGGVLEFLADPALRKTSQQLGEAYGVQMVICRKDRAGKLVPGSRVTIGAHDSARYDFDKREIVFKSGVNVKRNNMIMNSEFLKVLLEDGADGDDRFKELIAWCGERGMVTINGKGNPDAAGGAGDDGIGKWDAAGQYAQYKEESGELVITDRRQGMRPLVRLDDHEIRNHEIRYFTADQMLLATGDHGETRLSGGMGDYDKKKPAAESERTIITFKDQLCFERGKRRAVFTKDVNLRATGLMLDAQKLRIDFLDLEGVKRDDAAQRVEKITATENVDVLYEERRAKCDKLEMTPAQVRRVDARGRVLLDKFVLSGERQPEIETPGNGYFQARRITVYRYERAANAQKVVYIEAVGPGSGILGGEKSGLGRAAAAPGQEQDGTIINFRSHMVYDQMDETADFYGQVTADTGEQVLGTYRLIVRMIESPAVPGGPGNRREISMLDAIGNAQERVTLHWQRHHCEAARVVRVFSLGRPKVQDFIQLEGTPQVPAKVWEEKGAVFYGPKIVTNPQGTYIRSIGAGELTLLDRDTNEKAMVQYSGWSEYTVNGDNSRAKFYDNVILRRTDMQVTSDVMQADLVKDTAAAAASEPAPELSGNTDVSAATLPRRLNRVIVQGNVIVRQPNRRAVGHLGRVDMLPDGDVLYLEGGAGRQAEVDNRNGFKLLAPQMKVRESIGLIAAAGPGQVDITGQAADKTGAAANEGLGVASDGNYRLTYNGQMVYNMNDGKITFVRDVVMTQDALQARCQKLLITLDKSIEATEDNVKVASVDCEGDVYFNSFPGPVTGVADPFGMEGRTVRTRSQNATYSARVRKIVLSGTPRPQVLLQEKSPSGVLRTFQSDERVWIDTATGAVELRGDVRGHQVTQTWPAMIFPKEARAWLP